MQGVISAKHCSNAVVYTLRKDMYRLKESNDASKWSVGLPKETTVQAQD